MLTGWYSVCVPPTYSSLPLRKTKYIITYILANYRATYAKTSISCALDRTMLKKIKLHVYTKKKKKKEL